MNIVIRINAFKRNSKNDEYLLKLKVHKLALERWSLNGVRWKWVNNADLLFKKKIIKSIQKAKNLAHSLYKNSI